MLRCFCFRLLSFGAQNGRSRPSLYSFTLHTPITVVRGKTAFVVEAEGEWLRALNGNFRGPIVPFYRGGQGTSDKHLPEFAMPDTLAYPSSPGH